MANAEDASGFSLRQATQEDVPELSAILAAALFDDPPARWHIPEDDRRLPVMREFFALGLTALWMPHGHVFTTDPPIAVCCWVPPGGSPPTGLETDEVELAIEVIFRDFPLTFQVLELLDENHPREPHYYLPFMGVLPKWQGRGIGSALLRAGLETCDRDKVPAYLDASNESSRDLYLRHGFEVIRTLSLPDGPSFWQMWREPRHLDRAEPKHAQATRLLTDLSIALIRLQA